jgi:hypothetical protein
VKTFTTSIVRKRSTSASMLLALLTFAAVQEGQGQPPYVQAECGSIHGSITSEHGPAAEARIEARDLRGTTFRTTSDADGNYEFKGLRPASYSLWVEWPGHDSVWAPRVFVEAGEATQKDFRIDRSPSVRPKIISRTIAPFQAPPRM